MVACNSTLSDITVHEKPLWKGYNFHHFGLLLCAIFGLIATVIGLTLILLHATHYLKPWEQKHVIRILLLIPIYSVVSFLSYLYYQHAVYFDVMEGCYEAFAISSFFTLLCHYIAPNLHDQKDYFRTLKPVNWFWGVFGLQLCTGGENRGPFRKPRSGLTWFNIIWLGVFQYCFIRVFFTIVAVIAQINDVYCEDSLSPEFAHVWVQVFEAVSVTIAMFCLIQFYIQLKDDLAEHRPFLKVLCIKLVIFFSFWQTIVISFLSSSKGPLQPTPYVSYPDIKVGIPSVLLCIEMAIFAVMHIFAFPWKPYSIKHSYKDPLNVPGSGFSGGEAADMRYKGGPLGILALADAFNPWDIIKMTARGFRWMFVGYRHREKDSSYQTPGKLDQTTGYIGPTYAGSNEAATELRDERGRRDTMGAAEDDRAGLLTYQGSMGRRPSASPYRQGTGDSYDSQVDLSSSRARDPPPPIPGRPTRMETVDLDMKPSDFDDEDTAYHPGMGPNAGPGSRDSGGAPHPARRYGGGGQDMDANWPLPGMGQSQPPPRYYEEDPRRI